MKDTVKSLHFACMSLANFAVNKKESEIKCQLSYVALSYHDVRKHLNQPNLMAPKWLTSWNYEYVKQRKF